MKGCSEIIENDNRIFLRSLKYPICFVSITKNKSLPCCQNRHTFILIILTFYNVFRWLFIVKNIPQLHELHSIRTKLLNQSFKIFHAAPPSNCNIISSISFLSCSSIATILEIRVFNSVMSIFSRVSSCSTYVETERL